MKTLSKLFILGVAVVSFASCSNNTTSEGKKIEGVDANSTRGVKFVEFQGSQVSISAEDMITLKAAAAADDDAASTVKNIMGNLNTAENLNQQLDVKFHMEDAPVQDGLFVFGIESEDSKKLTLEMFDEEGFAMAANNVIQVNGGNNYKALKVNDLENGTYLFKLKDEAGKELNRQVTIANEK